MNRSELVKAMDNELRLGHGTSGALDVAMEEMLGDVMNNEPDDVIAFVAARRSRYLKPEIRPYAKSVIQSIQGHTLTADEADAVLAELMMVTHDWTPFKEQSK